MGNAVYEKVDPIAGSYRARLGVDLPITNGGFFGAVSLNATGRVILGTGGQSGLAGVLVKNVVQQPIGQFDSPPGIPGASFMQARRGDQVDIMLAGEIIHADKEAFPAGSKVYAAADGTISTTSAAGSFLIGFTVEAGRIRVAVAPGQAAQA